MSFGLGSSQVGALYGNGTKPPPQYITSNTTPIYIPPQQSHILWLRHEARAYPVHFNDPIVCPTPMRCTGPPISRWDVTSLSTPYHEAPRNIFRAAPLQIWTTWYLYFFRYDRSFTYRLGVLTPRLQASALATAITS